MKAIIFRRGSSALDAASLAEVECEDPVPGPHDLLVEVRAVSVNPVDAKVRAGLVRVPDTVGILGWDASGIVRAAGPAVSGFRPGDEVYYAGSFDRPGVNAELHCVDARLVGRKPRTLSFAQAAALPLTSLTAWQLLFDRFGVPRDGQPGGGAILIVGGAGGVGSMLIQLARYLTGLTVIATASRPESRDWCLSMGAHHVIDHSAPLARGVAAIGDPAITHVAALNHTDRHWTAIADLVAPQGKVGVITDHDTLDAAPLKAKSVSLHWEMVFTRPVFRTLDMARQGAILDEVAALVDAGRLRTTMSRDLSPLSAATLRQAHGLIESGAMIGKLALAV